MTTFTKNDPYTLPPWAFFIFLAANKTASASSSLLYELFHRISFYNISGAFFLTCPPPASLPALGIVDNYVQVEVLHLVSLLRGASAGYAHWAARAERAEGKYGTTLHYWADGCAAGVIGMSVGGWGMDKKRKFEMMDDEEEWEWERVVKRAKVQAEIKEEEEGGREREMCFTDSAWLRERVLKMVGSEHDLMPIEVRQVYIPGVVYEVQLDDRQELMVRLQGDDEWPR